MKRTLFVLATVAALTACGGDKKYDVKIDEVDAENQAYTDGERLAEKLLNAATYEEFIDAKSEIEAYKDAYRTRFGGQAYTNFLTSTSNKIDSSLGL